MRPRSGHSFRFSIYDAALSLDCNFSALVPSLQRLLGDFETGHLSGDSAPIRGSLVSYDHRQVVDRISSTARPVHVTRCHSALQSEPPELFVDGERIWMVDERWGMSEIDLLKARWTSWILPSPRLSWRACAEAAIHWPLAQLLRGRGLHLLPAASLVRGGVGLLILAPFSIAPELQSLIRMGFRLVGQRWTVLRMMSGEGAKNQSKPARNIPEMCQMPGWIDLPERIVRPWVRRATMVDRFIDLSMEHCGASRPRATCNVVLLVEPARRMRAGLRSVSSVDAILALRRAWPLSEPHPTRWPGHLAATLARQCAVYDVRLSRDPQDLSALLASLPRPRAAVPARGVQALQDGQGSPAKSISVTLHTSTADYTSRNGPILRIA